MYILGLAVGCGSLGYRGVSWGEASRDGAGSACFVGWEDLCVYEGYHPARWDAYHVPRLGTDIMMIDGMAFWHLLFSTSHFTVLAIVIPRVQPSAQHTFVQTEAPTDWIYEPDAPGCGPSLHLSGSKGASGSMIEEAGGHIMPPPRELRRVHSHPSHRPEQPPSPFQTPLISNPPTP